MGVAAAFVDAMLATWMPGDGLAPQILRLSITIAAALAVLAGAAHVLQVREFRQGVSLIMRRPGRT